MRRKIAAAVSLLLLLSVGLVAGAAPVSAAGPVAGGQPIAAKRLGGACTTTPGLSSCHYYATGSQAFSAGTEPTGMTANLRIDKPFLNDGTIAGTGLDPLSLAEITMKSGSIAGGDLNAVEVGWIHDSDAGSGTTICGSGVSVCVLATAWVDGVFQGYMSSNQANSYGNGGGNFTLNTSCTTFCRGFSLDANAGQTKTVGISHSSVNSRWEVSFNGGLLGWFPDSLWTAAGVTFVNATDIAAFGEVSNANGSTVRPCSDMGSGKVAGVSGDGNINGIALSGTSTAVNLSLSATDSGAYSVTTYGGAANGIRYGGPGFDADQDYLGVTGAAGTLASGAGGCAPSVAGTPSNTATLWRQECPDNNGTTGCGNGFDASASCSPAPCLISGSITGDFETWQNTSTSGKTFTVGRTAACTGSQFTLTPNASGTAKGILPAGWEAIRCMRRTA